MKLYVLCKPYNKKHGINWHIDENNLINSNFIVADNIIGSSIEECQEIFKNEDSIYKHYSLMNKYFFKIENNQFYLLTHLFEVELKNHDIVCIIRELLYGNGIHCSYDKLSFVWASSNETISESKL